MAISAVLWGLLTLPAAAQEIEATTVLEGLGNPTAVVVQNGTGYLYVAESAAQKVIRVFPTAGKSEDCITGFAKGSYGSGPAYDIGPLGLCFTADDKRLIVGGGGQADGEELAYVFDVPSIGRSIAVKDAKYKLGPIGKSDQSATGEGNFFGLVANDRAIYVTCNGDDKFGWIARSVIPRGQPQKLEPYIATRQLTETNAPTGICLSPTGDLVVSQMGAIDTAGDSRLTFYSSKTGRLRLDLPTELHDICGLAYSPKSPPLLYAVDFSWQDPAQGGLYRLDATLKEGRLAIKTVRLATLDKPTALAFDRMGNLFVTVFGTAADGDDQPAGKLLKFNAIDLAP